MSLTPSRKSSCQRRRSITNGSRYTHSSETSSTNTYPGRVRAVDVSPNARTYPSTPRRQVKNYAPCSDNHGIRPPTPEQYLTPLQQKEVCIRHLRARLRENVERLQNRDFEIDDLRTQLFKMQEEWIEGECHRLEAQLALKEARKEIQHLQEVVETVRSNLGVRAAETHDNKPYAGLQATHPGGRSRSCGCSPASTLSRNTSHKPISTDGLHLDPSGTPQRHQAHHLLLEAALLSEQHPSQGPLQSSPTVPCSSTFERLCSGGALLPISHSCHSLSTSCGCITHSYHPHHHHLFLHLPQEEPPLNVTTSSDPIPTPVTPIDKKTEVRSQACSPTMTWINEDSPLEEVSVISVSTLDMSSHKPPMHQYSLTHSSLVEHSVSPSAHDSKGEGKKTVTFPQTSQPHATVQLPLKQDCMEVEIEEETEPSTERTPTQRHHWSRYFLVDFLALAMPVVPTMAWLCRGAPREDMPVYHIGSLLRGCCAVALRSLRRQGLSRGGSADSNS